nr:hypothetical protein [Dysgonomonas sp.]
MGYFLSWRKGVYGILTGSKVQALQVLGKISTPYKFRVVFYP